MRVPWTVVVVLLALAAPAYAQPWIKNTTGAWVHKGTVTISGSAFGTKGTAPPVVWDDASAASILDNWDGAWPDNNPKYDTTYRLPMRGIPLPHGRITRYIAGAHAEGLGPQAGTIVAFFKNRQFACFPSYTRSCYPAYTYVSWYQRADDKWAFGEDNNYKTFLVSAPDFGYAGPDYWYLAYNTPWPDSRTSGASYIFGADSSGVTVRFPDARGHRQWWDEAVNPMSGVWTKVEMEIKYTNKNDGYVKLWENGVLRVDYAGHTDAMPGTSRSEGIGGYARMYNRSSNWRYFADVYLDYSRARVVLGNAPTFSASTVRELQIPFAWSDTSISIAVNLGAFADGQPAYLYVVDPDGKVNEAGFPINDR